ncbi:MAG: sn-glycerol-3-phosphate ABC transporter ATP-binding protein UgpC [Devosia sp.]
MASLQLAGVTKDFGATKIIRGVDLAVEDGEFVVFVGPSGCGKSTLLRLISGLDLVSSGQIVIGGRDVEKLSPAERGIAMVFQSYALYPHMTVAKNLSFGLENERLPRTEIDRQVMEAARILGLEPYLERRPKELSGGQRQRVAIGRAIVRNPDVFLFDEPLSNLDAALRVQTRAEIIRLHKRLGATMIYVTHDQIEAMTMADRIAVLNGGRLEQFGTPVDLFQHPANKFVATFIGSPRMNIYPGTLEGGGPGAAQIAVPGFGTIELAVDTGNLKIGAPVEIGVRPQHFRLAGEGAEAMFVVDYAESIGTETYVYGRIDGTEAETILHVPEHMPFAAEQRVLLRVPTKFAHVFRGDDGIALAPILTN